MGPREWPPRRTVVDPFWDETELVGSGVEKVSLTRLYVLLYEGVYGIDERMSRR